MSRTARPGQTGDAGGHVRTSEVGLVGGDHQQAVVLDALRRAAGAPVSYAELRRSGVELPASVVSELELAGVGVERCFSEGSGTAGVRLDPANDLAAGPTPDPAPLPIPTSRRAPGPASATAARPDPAADRPVRVNRTSRVLALAALLAAVAAVSSFVALWASGGDRAQRVPIAKRPHSRVVVASRGARPAVVPRSTRPSPPVPASPALAGELEAQGHGLLEAGRYSAAVPVLKRAVLATGETPGACREPASSTCLTYAYALYDLGRAVRLNGQPQAAVPILERRLQIDNQRPVVDAELQLARQKIG